MSEPSDPIQRPDEPEPLLAPAEEAELREALLYAWRPSELDPDLNEALIESALEDPLRAPDAAELVESERFRRALEGQGDHPDLELARRLSGMHGSAPDRDFERVHEQSLERALGKTPASLAPLKLVTLSFGIVGTLAAAAAVLLLLEASFFAEASKRAAPEKPRPELPRLTQSRSTEPLFDAKFERERTTRRVDRIASVRARELRDNRFKQWGVR